MPTKQYPSIDFVRQVLRYEDGKLFWIERSREQFRNLWLWSRWRSRIGKEAGCYFFHESSNGYRCVVTIDNIKILRYTVVWAIHHNEWRLGLDHKNQNSLDDRIENLRPATLSQNGANSRLASNNTSGYKGVSWRKSHSKWEARIIVNKNRINLGLFDDPAEAHAAYMKAAREHFGEFASNGKHN